MIDNSINESIEQVYEHIKTGTKCTFPLGCSLEIKHQHRLPRGSIKWDIQTIYPPLCNVPRCDHSYCSHPHEHSEKIIDAPYKCIIDGCVRPGPHGTDHLYSDGRTKVYEEVVQPNHYGGDESYEVLKALFAWGIGIDFCKGSAIKYIVREGKKPGVDGFTDMEKASYYLKRAAEEMKRLAEEKKE